MQSYTYFTSVMFVLGITEPVIRPSTSERIPSDMCAQRRFRSVWAFAQSDQNLHTGHILDNKDTKFLHAYNEDSNQTARMRRLIWAFDLAHMSEAIISHIEVYIS